MNFINNITDSRVYDKSFEVCLKMTDARKECLPLFNAVDEQRRTAYSRTAKVTHLVIDFDDNCSYILWKHLLKGFEHWMYFTASCQSEQARFRVVLPLKEAVEARHIKYKQEMLSRLFVGCDRHSFDVGRWFYCPSKYCGAYKLVNTVVHNDGAPFDFYKVVIWSRIDELNMKAKKNKIKSKFCDMSDDERITYYLSTEFPLMKGNGDSASSLYTAICVCLAHKDEDSLAEVLDKARRENWSEREIARKIKDAKSFLDSEEDDD